MDGIVHRDASRVGWRRDATEDIAAGPSTADERDAGPLVPDAQPPRVRHARASGILGDKGLSFADRYVCRDGNRNTAKESAIRSHLMQDTVPRSGLPRSADAVVVGGGCMGTSIAWHLARRGVRVVVLERTHLAAGATGHSGALVRQHYEARIGIRLARESLAFFQRFEKETGFSADFRTTGFLCGTRERNLPAFEALVELLRAEGVRAERLAPSEAKTMEPQLEVSDYAAVVHDPDAGYADPIATTHGFAKAAEAEGAKVYGDHEVSSITTRSGSVVGVKIRGAGLLSAERVILAAGNWTRDLAATIAPRLPVRYVRGEVAILRRPVDFGPPPKIHFDFYGNTYSRPEGEKDTLAGYMNTDPRKTMSGHAFTESVPAATVRDLRTRLAKRFPRMTDAQPRGGWTGAYDVTPDSYPILDRTGPDGLFVAVGFSGHGFKLSPAVGRLVAEFVATGKRPEALVPLRASRFAEKQPVHADAPFPAGGRRRIP
ncbi:MAG: FAD-binding oxidoreductase [Methanobacteriota archaeon]|nr:MAG: FAD-binding oxidoreductase [Euryarchaeota archaeon]